MATTKVAVAAGSVPQDLIAELNRRAVSDAAAYKRLVSDTANGRSVGAEEAEATIAAAGKTVGEFTAAVELIRERRREEQFLATLPALQAAAVTAETAIAAKRSEISHAVAVANAELRSLEHVLGQAMTSLSLAQARADAIRHGRAADLKNGRDEWRDTWATRPQGGLPTEG